MSFKVKIFGRILAERLVSVDAKFSNARRGCGARGAPALPMRTAMERRPYRCGAADREPPFPFSGLYSRAAQCASRDGDIISKIWAGGGALFAAGVFRHIINRIYRIVGGQ